MIANMAQWVVLFGGFRGNDNQGGGMLGGLAMMIPAPIAATLIQLAVSRSREYAADAGGAEIAGSQGLASALRKLEQANHAQPMQSAERNPASAHLFIVNPLSGASVSKLFSTHPATEERVRRLESMAPGTRARM